MEGSFVAASREAWIRQAKEAWQRLDQAREKAGMPKETALASLSGLDYEAFCLLIEAMHALGQPISQELLDQAAMRPVSELFSY